MTEADIKIAVLEERLEGAKEALSLQALEYQRRLDALNGEAERLRQMQSTYLPRESYEIAHRELVNKIEIVQKICFIGIGVAIAVEFLLSFLK